jgi:hypothetical protein
MKLLPIFGLLCGVAAVRSEPVQVSGVYPQLAMFNNEGECGTGAVVPWADRLWVITYAPHMPKGSSDKLYEITPALKQIVRPESIGGTPANRMIHEESGQLFIGPYAIDSQRTVRAMPYATMFGRHTGLARHLTDPAGKLVLATMEEGIYELDVKTLEHRVLWADEQVKQGRHADLPGYHGKGFYSAQGRYVYANNGDHAPAALRDPTVPSGVLAEWDGQAAQWTVVRRNQFTEVTGPGGIHGSAVDDPVWSIGWDHRSLILMCLHAGRWHSYRLPKSSHSYDGAHGWNTEWPRIRDIGEDALLMTMHGAFWRFPKDFTPQNSAGISPRSNYLKVIGDFCRWQDRVVLGCDDTAKSEFLNKHPLKGNLAGPGQSQSNLWFIPPAKLDQIGPVMGRGALWIQEDVKAGTASDPYLLSGFDQRSLHVLHQGAEPLSLALEIDAKGDGQWQHVQDIVVPVQGQWVELSQSGSWLRLTPKTDAKGLSAVLHYRNTDARSAAATALFEGVGAGQGGVLLTRGKNLRTLRYVHGGVAYDLDGELKLRRTDDVKGAEWTAAQAAVPDSGLRADAASAYYEDDKGRRWRLPKGKLTQGARVAREICTERNLLNAYGTFYEFPAENAGGFPKIRPVCTHDRDITDYASYRGMLVLSGVNPGAEGPNIVQSDDKTCALWAGVVDDLWQLGKPRGEGGVWKDAAVKAQQPSDSYLCTGYDNKQLRLKSSAAAKITVEVDLTGNGLWAVHKVFSVQPDAALDYDFPAAFGGYWLRFTSNVDATVTAWLKYE